MAKVVFDPTKVSISVNLVPITGWADGDVFLADFTTNKVSKHIGTGGEGRFIVSADISGTCTIRVADYSLANAGLSIIDTVGVPVIITCTDKSSVGDLFFTEAAMVQKIPPFEKGAEAKMKEWVFEYINARIVHTGAAEL